jgi:chromosome segregation ATPase
MGKITDILAEVPLSAVLKERVAIEEAKAAALETKCADLLAEIEVLRHRLKEAEEEIRVLKERVKLFEAGDQGGYHVME